jgi:hypothetical protein
MPKIRHGADPSDAIDRLYSEGRSYRSQPHETRHPATPRATGDISQTYHRHGEVRKTNSGKTATTRRPAIRMTRKSG